jgi:hypothetical protein
MMQTRLASPVALALGLLAFAQAAEQERRNTTPPVPLADHLQPRARSTHDDDAAGGRGEASNRR